MNDKKNQHTEPTRDGCCENTSIPLTNVLFCRNMSLLVAAVITLITTTHPIPAQAIQPVNPQHSATDTQNAQRAYNLVKSWITAGKTPQDTPPIYAQNISATLVTLRWHGLTIAQAQATKSDILSDNIIGGSRPTNVAKLAHKATNTALIQAAHAMRAARYHAATTADDPSSTRSIPLQDVGPKLQVDLQIAFEPQKISIPSTMDRSAIYPTFEPGYHALRMAPFRGHHQPAWVWPASTLASNTSQWSQLIQLLTQSGYEVADFPDIAHPDGPTLHKFDIIHITQSAPDAPPITLTRGVKTQLPHALSGQQLETLAKRITDFLLTKQRDDGQSAGTYYPSLDQHNPPTALPHDLALAAYALTERARFLADTDAQNPQRQAAATAAHRATSFLLKQTPPDTITPKTQPLAALLLASLADPPTPKDYDRRSRDALAAKLSAIQNTPPNPNDFIIDNPTTLGLTLIALTATYERTKDPELLTTILDTRDRLWQDIDQTALLKRLPWQALAELRLRRALRAQKDPDNTELRNQHTETLLQLITNIRRHQVTSPPTNGPSDIVGGFRFRRTNAPQIPDWNSSRALYFLAAALSDEQLTADQDTLGWLLTCGLAARFVNQLTFDDPACYYVRSRADALGGVRLSPIDNRLAIGPTATTLLAITELQQAVHRLTGATHAHNEPQP